MSGSISGSRYTEHSLDCRKVQLKRSHLKVRNRHNPFLLTFSLRVKRELFKLVRKLNRKTKVCDREGKILLNKDGKGLVKPPESPLVVKRRAIGGGEILI